MQLERRGIPSVLIGTDRFRSVLEATRRMCGIDEVQWAEVLHPLGSLLADELRARAELAVTQFEAIVLAKSPL